MALKKLDMFTDFVNNVDRQLKLSGAANVPFGAWPETEKIVLDGKLFSFKKHEYLIEPYKDDHSFQVEIKATQLGLTSKALLRVIYGCRYGSYRGILYLFPSRTDVTDLSKTRLNPLLEDNPDNIGTWLSDTDSANVKKIWNSFLYLRGMKSRTGLKCHDDKTEILTRDGWKFFKDVTLDDHVLYKSQNNIPRYTKIKKIHSGRHEGKMYLFQSDEVDFCVTGNHRLYVEHPGGFSIVEAEVMRLSSGGEIPIDINFRTRAKLPEPQLVDYDSWIYCVSISGGLLFTRRNGKTVWSGNSVPIDFEVFDELDESPPNAVDMALERMAHSDTGDLLFLSNPTLPDYGIDKLFQTTDQQYFLLKCPHCGEYNNLVDDFPNCLIRFRGATIRACRKCRKELDPSVGTWVAKRPSITERRGRQYSQLYAQTKTTSPEFILSKFEQTDNLPDFYNLKIGLAYVDAQNRLSTQEVLACCGTDGMSSSSEAGCFMGVDQGGHLHVVIGQRHPTRRGRIVYVDVLKGNNNDDKDDDAEWYQLDALMNRFRVMRCVVDAMPNIKAARNFAERFPGRVFLCYYSEFQKGHYRWSEKDMTVHVNRTESLDNSHKEITMQQVVIPRKSDMIDEFAAHMHNVAKRLEEDEDSGSQRYVYLRLGPDHFRHAFNYESMARKDAPELLFEELI